GIDAIVYIVGTALCLEKLGINKITASKLPMGSGFADCQHGKLPIPAPATIEILKDVPIYGTETTNELVTPTGAAIIASLAESFGPLPAMNVKKTGYGAGHRELQDRPNLLRIITGTPLGPKMDSTDRLQTDQILILETCIDDMNPELFGFLMERMFEDGALDVYWIPVHMKKNRPGTMVQVLCKEDHKDKLIRRLLAETTSLGIRYYYAHRQLLARDQLTITTSLGEIRVKRIKDQEGSTRLIPEYEGCKEIALQKKIPLRVVYDTIAKEAAEVHKKKAY
ncbi:MAG: LarC family nickel insertion protein, partial [Deltaproteobacteria bacterium]|nr:LarC family nickel insertion protein [Deltaproteobacteria bacterium]